MANIDHSFKGNIDNNHRRITRYLIKSLEHAKEIRKMIREVDIFYKGKGERAFFC
jgi:hypothetical protein